MATWSDWIQEVGGEVITDYAESEFGSNNQSPPPAANPATGQTYDPATQQTLAALSDTTARTMQIVAWSVAAAAALVAVVLIARRR